MKKDHHCTNSKLYEVHAGKRIEEEKDEHSISNGTQAIRSKRKEQSIQAASQQNTCFIDSLRITSTTVP